MFWRCVIGKKKTTTTQQNNYQYITPPKNPYYDTAKQYLDQLDYKTDVRNAYARAGNQVREAGSELFGADVPQELRDKERDNNLFRLKLDEGKAIYQANQAETAAKLGGNMSLGAATAPQLVNTGGTSTMVQPFDWGGLLTGGLGAGGQIGAAAY